MSLSVTGGAVVLTSPTNSLGRLSASSPTSLQVVNAKTLFIDQVIVTGSITIGVVQGDLRVGPLASPPALLQTNTTVDLRGVSGKVILENGGRIVAPGGTTLAPNQSVNLPVPSGNAAAAALAAAINQANSLKLPSIITIDANTSIPLSALLPIVQAPITLTGTNVTFVGSVAAPIGLQLGAAAAGSTVSGITFQGFATAGITLTGVQKVTVSGIAVVSSGVGITATGNLAGTRILNSSFTNNTNGVILDNALNLVFGSIGKNEGNRIVSTSKIGSGLIVSNAANGTVVQGNTISGYGYGIQLTSATGVTIGGTAAAQRNTVSSAAKAGVFASGFCTNSQVIKTAITTTVTPYNVRTARNLRVVQ